MYIKWMVRRDEGGVDLGNMGQDTRLGHIYAARRTLRQCRACPRASNADRTTGERLEEITDNLRLIDPSDPVKYDFRPIRRYQQGYLTAMSNKYFRFKTIHRETGAVRHESRHRRRALGAWVAIPAAVTHILDIGTGTGPHSPDGRPTRTRSHCGCRRDRGGCRLTSLG